MAVPERVRATAAAVYVGVAGLVASVLGGTLVVDITGVTAPGPRLVATAAGLGLGTATVAYFYLRWTRRGRSHLDVALPDRRDALVAVVGAGALAAVVVGFDALYGLLGVSTATHATVTELAGAGGPALLAAAVVASLALVGPGEELLFRNVVQKSLYGVFSRPGAVVVASLVFALAHAPVYLAGADSATALAATLATVFALSVVLGGTYAASENVVVPAAVHGVYNAATYVLLLT